MDGRSRTTGEQYCTLKRLPSSFKVALDLSRSDLPGHVATQLRRWAPTFRRNMAYERWRHDLLQFRNPHSRLHGVTTQNTTHSRQAAMAWSVKGLGYGKGRPGHRLSTSSRRDTIFLSTPKFAHTLSNPHPHTVYRKGAGLRYARGGGTTHLPQVTRLRIREAIIYRPLQKKKFH